MKQIEIDELRARRAQHTDSLPIIEDIDRLEEGTLLVLNRVGVEKSIVIMKAGTAVKVFEALGKKTHSEKLLRVLAEARELFLWRSGSGGKKKAMRKREA